MMRTSSEGVALIKSFEGFRANAYQDIVGVWTIGYGETEGVNPGDVVTEVEGEAMLLESLNKYEGAVERGCRVPPTQSQFDAMVSLCYNIGIAGFERSTVLKAHNRRDFSAAGRAFNLWNKAGGREVAGLTRRRAAESALYLRFVADDGDFHGMPQRVDMESGARHSPTVWGASTAAVTAPLAMVSESARYVQDAKFALGDWLPWVLVAIAVGAAGWAIWSRVKTRRGGWA